MCAPDASPASQAESCPRCSSGDVQRHRPMASWPLPGAIGVSPTGVGADLATASVDGRAEAVCWLEQAGNRSKSRTVTTTRCKACLTRIVVRWVGFRRTEDDL